MSGFIASPRIYYHSESLIGSPIKTAIITTEAFDYILSSSPLSMYQIPEKYELKMVNGRLDSVPVEMYRYAYIRKDGISYKADEGTFYLPEAIVFFDESDYSPYPSEFYFIAKVKGQLELCRSIGGKDIKWYQTADRHSGVSCEKLIKKAEQTFEELVAYVGYAIEDIQEEKRKTAQEVASRKPISAGKKAAYTALTELCMPHSPKKKQVLSFIDELKEHEGTYDDFRMMLNSNLIPFIITLDWKESIQEMNAWVVDAVENNFGKQLNYDVQKEFDDEACISDDGVFAKFDHHLRKIGLQLTFFDTSDKDEYELIIHPTDKMNDVCTAADAIGVLLGSISE